MINISKFKAKIQRQLESIVLESEFSFCGKIMYTSVSLRDMPVSFSELIFFKTLF